MTARCPRYFLLFYYSYEMNRFVGFLYIYKKYTSLTIMYNCDIIQTIFEQIRRKGIDYGIFKDILEQKISACGTGKKGIKLKYRRSYLGILWSLLEPILTTIILTIVFGTLFDNSNKTFPVYILSGRLLYSFFSSGTKACAKSIRSNAGMIKKVYVRSICIRCLPYYLTILYF